MNKEAFEIVNKLTSELVELRFAIAWSIVYQNNLALIKMAKNNEQITAMISLLVEERGEKEK